MSAAHDHGIEAIDHVQIAIPAGGEAASRAFWIELLGFVEMDKPENLAANGGCWFARGPIALHVGIDPHFHPATKAHVAFRVGDLTALRERLERGGVTVRDGQPLPDCARFFADDPFGNRLEFLELAV